MMTTETQRILKREEEMLQKLLDDLASFHGISARSKDVSLAESAEEIPEY